MKDREGGDATPLALSPKEIGSMSIPNRTTIIPSLAVEDWIQGLGLDGGRLATLSSRNTAN